MVGQNLIHFYKKIAMFGYYLILSDLSSVVKLFDYFIISQYKLGDYLQPGAETIILIVMASYGKIH